MEPDFLSSFSDSWVQVLSTSTQPSRVSASLAPVLGVANLTNLLFCLDIWGPRSPVKLFLQIILVYSLETYNLFAQLSVLSLLSLQSVFKISRIGIPMNYLSSK